MYVSENRNRRIPGKVYFFGPPICEFLKSLLFWTFRFALENKKSTFLDVTPASHEN